MNQNKNLYAVILAGGSGTRFWPKSRKEEPKQFLKIIGEKSLFQETLLRIKPKIKGPRVLIVTNKKYCRKVQEQAAAFGVPRANILLEPEGKNTAPAICWAAAHLYKKDKNAVMAVLPSDHLIVKQKAFLKHLAQAGRLALDGYLVTLGIIPTRAETGYGYLKIKPAQKTGRKVWMVEKFTEKPSAATAKKFLKTKKYLWNSGMFIWRCETILNEFRVQLPAVYKIFKEKIDTANVYRAWPRLPSISIDYGILEKAGKVATIPAGDMGWSDLGSWESLCEVLQKKKKDNIFNGDIVPFQAENTFVWGAERLIAVVGLKNMIVVDTKDALLICRKDLSQDVKKIVETLKKKRKELL